MDEINDLADVALQTSRRLRAQLDEAHSQLNETHAQRDSALAELAALRRQRDALREALAAGMEALEFYGDPLNYQPREDAHGHRQRPIMVYKHTRARPALQKFSSALALVRE